jgi:hypothetical protein
MRDSKSLHFSVMMIQTVSPDPWMLFRGLRGRHSPARRLSRFTTNGNEHKYPYQSFNGGGQSAEGVRECPGHQNGTIIAKLPIHFSPPDIQLQQRRSQGGNKEG